MMTVDVLSWNLTGDLENGVLSGVMGMDGFFRLRALLATPGRDLREPREASHAPLLSR